MKTILSRLLCLALLFAAPVAVTVRAQDLGAIKSSMAQRLPSIDALKSKGALGENNQGYLEVRASAPEADSLAAAENKDRAVVYAAIAKQTNSTAAQVGQARARQLVAASAPGVWVQRDSGEWYRK